MEPDVSPRKRPRVGPALSGTLEKHWRLNCSGSVLCSARPKSHVLLGKSYGQTKAGITAIFMFKYGGISVESNKDHSEVV